MVTGGTPANREAAALADQLARCGYGLLNGVI
jgi:hypothetical protein